MELESVTTDRTAEIRKIIGNVLNQLLTEGSDEMEAYFKNNTDKVAGELYDIMNNIYQSAHEAQTQEKIGKLRYIRIFPRMTAVMEGTYSFMIRVYDDTGYRNPTEVSAEWNPEFLVRLYERQLAVAEKKVAAQLFRITTREQQLVKQLFAEAFHFLSMMFLTILRTVFVFVENIQKVENEDKLVLTYGNYLEEGAVIEVFDNPGGSEA